MTMTTAGLRWQSLSKARWSRFGSDEANLGVAALLLLALVAYPVLMSARAIDWAEIAGLFDSRNTRPLLNSVALTFCALVPSLLIAVPMAWLCTRTDLPLRGALGALVATSFVMPMLLTSIAYVFLFGRNGGLVNLLFRDLIGGPIYNIYSFSGVVFVAVLHSYPLIFFTTASGLTKMNPELEESARSCGLSSFQVFRRITLGAILPSILAGTAFSIAFNLTMLSGPLVLGMPVGIPFATTEMYAAIVMNPNIGRAIALSIPLIAVTLLALWIQNRLIGGASERYAVVGGKGNRQSVIALGRWRFPALLLCSLPILLSLVLPLLTLLAAGLMRHWWKGLSLDNFHLGNFQFLLADPTTLRAIWNSILLSGGTGIFLAICGAALAIVLAGRPTVLKSALRSLAELPLGIPHVVAGILTLLAWYGMPFHLGGTIWLLALGYVLVMLPYAFRTCDTARGQVDGSLTEAARVAGCSVLQSWRLIMFPLIRNGLFTTFVIVFLFVIKEFPLTALIYSANTVTLAVRVFTIFEGGNFEKTGAAAVLLVLITFLTILVAAKLFRINVTTVKI